MRLLKHTIYNVSGLAGPLIVAIFAIPVLISQLGDAKFGLLTLVWAVVSYASLFDLGLGRALTHLVSVSQGSSKQSQIGSLAMTSYVLMAALGAITGLLMAGFAPYCVDLISSVPDRNEAVLTVYVMAAAMPAILLTSGFRGLLEAQHAFGILNLIRFPLGLISFLGPVAVVMYWGPRLDLIAVVLAVARLAACFAHGYFARRLMPADAGPQRIDVGLVRPLFEVGGWMTISNVISPVMSYLDRFIIGGLVSASAVAFYATPQEVVTKLWLIPGALTAVLFPEFSRQIARGAPSAAVLIRRALISLFVLMLPITATLAIFAPELLRIWLGAEYSRQSSLLLQLFSVGAFVVCIAHIPFIVIQGAGMPKLTAAVHAVELPFYLGGLYVLTRSFGISGAAFAWLLRICVDAVLMAAAARAAIRPLSRPISLWAITVGIFIAVGSFSGALLPTLIQKALWLFIVICVSALLFKAFDKIDTALYARFERQ